MPFQFRTYVKTFFQSFKLNAPWTGPRIGLMLFMYGLFPLLEIFNWMTLMVDEVFFRGYKKVQVKAPVFIVGNPRSGTTYLHRLMSLNKGRFNSLKMYDMIFLSVWVKKLIGLAAAIDDKIGRPMAKLLEKVQAVLFREADKIHKMRLNHPEEDEAVMIHTFFTIYIAIMFPVPAMEVVNRFDELPDDLRRKLTDFYKRCIQRHLYCHGGDHYTLLSKNPTFCTKLKSILEVFPDARVVYIARRPYESVASTHNMIDKIQKTQLKLDREDDRHEIVLDTVVYFYQHALEIIDQHDQALTMTVTYDDLVNSPRETVEAIYKKFDIPQSEEDRAELVRVTEKNKSYKSKHQYSLDQFGLTKVEVYRKTRSVFERFGFDPEGADRESEAEESDGAKARTA